MSVDLPAPDGPTRNTKSPSGMTRSTSRRASLPLGYCLRDVVEDEDRPFLLGVIARPAEDPTAEGSLRARRWGDGHVRLRGRGVRRSPLVIGLSTPSAGTARRATSGAEATTGAGVRQT